MSKLKRGTGPSVGVIHDYWLHQATHDSEWLIDNVGETSYLHILQGEGQDCYACGRHRTNELEKCHIIPHSLGGSMWPDNLFLMCCDCHSDNPDSIHTELFFNYVRGRDLWFARDFMAMMLNLKKLNSNCSDEDRESFNRFFESEPTETTIKELCGSIVDECINVSGRFSDYTKAGFLWLQFVKEGRKMASR